MSLQKPGHLHLLLVLWPAAAATAQEDNFIDATRPSVSESATIQRAGVLQIETGIECRFPRARLSLAAKCADRVSLCG
ncbi:MAG: hypothetical protein ACR2FI_08640 [Burkholderiales bacterium]|nr:hypothetical protein [Burkholderiales bacterium]MDQ3195043.1 hypothetical protein [Pseudomonadota bacterium]